DFHSLLQMAFGLGLLDHVHADAILDRAQWVEELKLEPDIRGKPLSEPLKLDERSGADGLGDVLIEFHEGVSPSLRRSPTFAFDLVMAELFTRLHAASHRPRRHSGDGGPLRDVMHDNRVGADP